MDPYRELPLGYIRKLVDRIKARQEAGEELPQFIRIQNHTPMTQVPEIFYSGERNPEHRSYCENCGWADGETSASWYKRKPYMKVSSSGIVPIQGDDVRGKIEPVGMIWLCQNCQQVEHPHRNYHPTTGEGRLVGE